MKLQKSTWFLLCLAIILGGWVYFYEIKLEAQKTAIEKEDKKLFNFDFNKIQKISISQSTATKATSLELIKTEETSTSWLMKQPEAFPVNEGVISFLLNLIEQDTINRQLLVAQKQLSQYGLEQPVAIITIELSNQETHQILLGKETINPSLVYAQINPLENNDGTAEISIVSKNWHYAVIRELKEWQNFSQ